MGLANHFTANRFSFANMCSCTRTPNGAHTSQVSTQQDASASSMTIPFGLAKRPATNLSLEVRKAGTASMLLGHSSAVLLDYCSCWRLVDFVRVYTRVFGWFQG